MENFENLLETNEEKVNPADGRENEKTDLLTEKKAASELNYKLDRLIEKNQFKETQSRIYNSSSQIVNYTKNQSKSHDDKGKTTQV